MALRLPTIAIPASLAIAAGGIYLSLAARDRNVDPSFREPRHPVTAAMVSATAACEGKPAPLFEARTWDGRPLRLRDLLGKPVVLIAVKDGCPCSYESQPYFNQLAHGYEERAVFLGAIQGDAALAKKWMSDLEVPYEVAPDPDKKLLKAYRAPRSVYVTLIGKDGIVLRMWPGWSKAMLEEMNRLIAAETGATPVNLNLAGAPIKPNSGCEFE